jgi:hypothetical protein
MQDASGAILVRLPDDVDTQPGRRLSVSGVVGTYYGAPQLTAATAVDQGAAQPEAADVHAAPIAPALEWRLVTVSGMIESVHRDGEAWRAELKLATGALPIVGLERSGISATALVAGRRATITGIVKRAYPTASDQRLGIVPRSAADIVLGAAPQPTGRPSGSSPKPGSHATPRPSSQTTARPSTSAAPGSELLIGGSVTSISGTVVVLSDATGDHAIELVGQAAPLAGTLEIGDLVNATATLSADGRLIVEDPGALVRVDGLGNTGQPPSIGGPASHIPQMPPDPAAQTPQTAPVVAFGALFGLTLVLVIGAFAVKLSGPDRVRKWSNRLKSRKPPI